LILRVICVSVEYTVDAKSNATSKKRIQYHEQHCA
jgi:hypothetical protein